MVLDFKTLQSWDGFPKYLSRRFQESQSSLYPEILGGIKLTIPFAVISTTQFAAYGHFARVAIKEWPSWLRPFVGPFLPQTRKLNHQKTRGGQLLAPLLKHCLERAQDEKSGVKGYEDEQGTMISWLLRHMDQKKRADPLVLGTNQMMRKSFSCQLHG